MMNTKQRSLLRSKANPLKPLIFVGKEGLTENVINETNTALYHNELIKLGLQKACPLTAKEVAAEIVQATDAEVVQILGSKVTLYKYTDKEGFEHLLI